LRTTSLIEMTSNASANSVASLPALRANVCPTGVQPRSVHPGAGWLEVARIGGQSAVVGCAAASPLRLLVPIPRGRAVWTIAATLGGGLLAGDAIDLAVTVGAGAALYLGTQAETKIHRAVPGGTPARQTLSVQVGAGGLLALLPDPVSPYAHSRYEQRQRFELEPGASLLLLDAVTAGRAARGERWAFERYAARNEIAVGGRTVLADGLRLAAAEGPPLEERLQGVELLATLVAIGPSAAAGARAILDALSTAPAPADAGAPVLAAASPLADGVLLRLAARSVEDGMAAIRAHLAFAAALLGDDPLARRP